MQEADGCPGKGSLNVGLKTWTEFIFLFGFFLFVCSSVFCLFVCLFLSFLWRLKSEMRRYGCTQRSEVAGNYKWTHQRVRKFLKERGIVFNLTWNWSGAGAGLGAHWDGPSLCASACQVESRIPGHLAGSTPTLLCQAWFLPSLLMWTFFWYSPYLLSHNVFRLCEPCE